ncbi:MAG: pilus assembly protein N-terminal domain-containing protein [Methyloceanibacter sp.]|nr:pilus assembly protein N-terminal domain-containing protein [Methyloceanibacter sp.]
MLHLERSAAEIVVGNPSIADVAVQNRRWRQFRARCGRHYRGTPFSEHGPLRSRYH